MKVVSAVLGDFSAWLQLAAEVESLFGPMVHEPSFHKALQKNINRRTALCIRKEDGPPGQPLLGALLYSAKPPQYNIGWLAVTHLSRRQGIGQKLFEHLMELIKPPAEILVTTFGQDVKKGQPARQFYLKNGFEPWSTAPNGPEGGSRIVLRRELCPNES